MWEAAAGEVLECVRELQGQYAVTVKKKENNCGTIIYHECCQECVQVVKSVFVLRQGGTISCTVTGGKRYSRFQFRSNTTCTQRA